MNKTYRHIGSRTICVASGDHAPGATGIELTEDEARRLLAMGAVEVEEGSGATPAPARRGAANQVKGQEE